MQAACAKILSGPCESGNDDTLRSSCEKENLATKEFQACLAGLRQRGEPKVKEEADYFVNGDGAAYPFPREAGNLRCPQTLLQYLDNSGL